MHTWARKTLVAVAAVTLMSACATNPYTGEREVSKAGKGAGIGAAVGAVAGVLTGDDADERRKRALIGAGIGALAGLASARTWTARRPSCARSRAAPA